MKIEMKGGRLTIVTARKKNDPSNRAGSSTKLSVDLTVSSNHARSVIVPYPKPTTGEPKECEAAVVEDEEDTG